MLRSLVSTKPSQSQKKEEKKAIKGFMKLLDSKMEQNIQVSPTPGHNSYHKKRDSHDFEDDTELKPTVHPKKLDALDSLEERKRALLYFDKEAERRRIENLDRLRQQNEMNKIKMQEKEQKNRRPGNSAEFLGKRDPLEDQYTLKKPSGYNPLAPISSKPELKSKSKTVLDTNDPANDPRFMFTLDEVGRSEKTNKKIPTTKSYNPLSTQRPVGIHDLFRLFTFWL